jgi:hypothetical protein
VVIERRLRGERVCEQAVRRKRGGGGEGAECMSGQKGKEEIDQG